MKKLISLFLFFCLTLGGQQRVDINSMRTNTATMQSAATGNTQGTALTVDGYGMATLTINCSSCSGGTLITFKVRNDGSNYTAIEGMRVDSTTHTISATLTTSGITQWIVPVQGWKQLIADISAYSAGTITVTGVAIPGGGMPIKLAITDSRGGDLLNTDIAPIRPWEGTLASGVVSSAMTGTTSTQVISGTASNYIYVKWCHFSNDHAATDTNMILQDGSGGTTIWKGLVPHGSGNDAIFQDAPLKVTTSGNGLYVANVTTSSSTYVTCGGFKSTTSY